MTGIEKARLYELRLRDKEKCLGMWRKGLERALVMGDKAEIKSLSRYVGNMKKEIAAFKFLLVVLYEVEV